MIKKRKNYSENLQILILNKMYILTQLIEAKSLEEVKAIEKKYMNILPDNQKWKFMNLVNKTKNKFK